MPPLPPAGQVLRVRLIGSYFSRPWNNILHVKYEGNTPTTPDLESYCSAFANAWQANIGPLCSTQVMLTTVVAQDLTSSTAANGEASVSINGGLVGATLSIQAAMVISWVINVRYRGGHPRTYTPAGLQTDVVQGNVWSPTFLLSARPSAAGFFNAINAITVAGGTSFLVGLSYKTNKAFRPAPIAFPVTGALVHPRVDTQRRRLGKEIIT